MPSSTRRLDCDFSMRSVAVALSRVGRRFGAALLAAAREARSCAAACKAASVTKTAAAPHSATYAARLDDNSAALRLTSRTARKPNLRSSRGSSAAFRWLLRAPRSVQFKRQCAALMFLATEAYGLKSRPKSHSHTSFPAPALGVEVQPQNKRHWCAS